MNEKLRRCVVLLTTLSVFFGCGLRNQDDVARRARDDARHYRSQAWQAQAATDAPETWNEAERLHAAAGTAFVEERYREAARAWRKATTVYGRARDQALDVQAERKRLAETRLPQDAVGDDFEDERLTLERRQREAVDAENERQALTGQHGPLAKQIWISPATGMEFVWIDALGIWVGKYEVTNEEYREKYPEHDSMEFEGHSLNADRQPAVYVDFDDARAYASWLTERDKASLGGMRYRLPSEDEWLTFAQCGDNRQYPWGDNWPAGSGAAGNYRDATAQREVNLSNPITGYNDGFAVTAPVDELWRNPWGLHGVGGNVWEVCASDSTGEKLGAWRGASWYDSFQDFLRCSYRLIFVGSPHSNCRGFRLVLSKPAD